MGIPIESIKDERLRRHIIQILGAGSGESRHNEGKQAEARVNPSCEAKAGTANRPARPTRIRQSQKPLLNKLEQEWFDLLVASHWMDNLRAQARRYRLANGHWYKPDMTGNDTRNGRETAYEVKGPHAFRGGFENLKVAASTWTEVKWILVWKEHGQWQQQEILP